MTLLMTSDGDTDEMIQLTRGKIGHAGFYIQMQSCAWLYMKPPILLFITDNILAWIFLDKVAIGVCLALELCFCWLHL